MANPNERILEITFSRVALTLFALRLFLKAIGRSGEGRKLQIRAEDGKDISIVFRI